jgi:hypothetical protein
MHLYPGTGGTRKQLPQVLASYSAGIPISFGDLTVTQQGLSLDHGRKTLLWLIFSRPIHTILWLSLNHGRKTLLWSAVGKIELSQYSGLSIGKQGKFWNWYSNASMPNAQTFLEFASALGVR